ncbi:MAG: replicative DNA helicase [Myxococcota bacterium]
MSSSDTPAGTVRLGDAIEIVKQQTRELLQEAVAKALPSPKDHLHAHEAERGVLCAILLDGDKYEEAILEGLRDRDFHHPAHAIIFHAMGRLHHRHQPIDFVTLTEQLTRDGKLDAAGGPNLLAQLESLLPTTAHAGAYVKLVRDKAVLRQLIDASRQIVRRAFQPDGEIDDVIDRAEASILSIRRESAHQSAVRVGQVTAQALERYGDLYHNKTSVTGVPSGFSDFDRLTHGLQSTELVVVAARPSMGKTAFTLNIAAHAAVRHNKPVAFFSMEMSVDRVVDRLISAESRVNLSDLNTGRIRKKEYEALSASAEKLDESPLYIDGTASLSVCSLRSKARCLVQRYNVGLIIVDYLQLMRGTSTYDNKATEVGEISKGLKTLAKELQIPVIALSQLNRGVESRTDKRPMMSDLRESGAIEQDADVVALLYREEYYLRDRTPQELEGIAEVIIAKNRNGPTGSFKLRFASGITRFDNLAEEGSVRRVV